jgi:hypothetical protein
MPGEIFDFHGVFSQLAQISCAMTIGLGIATPQSIAATL